MSVSPGNTWDVNLPEIYLKFVTSFFNNLDINNLQEIPKVQRPCNIGYLNPPISAIYGSMCRGFASPFNLYKIA